MAGDYLESGYRTIWSFSANPSIELEEITLKPPGVSRRGGINTSSMRNNAAITKTAKKLTEYSNVEGSCKYKVDSWTQIVAMLGVNQLLTITYPDTKTCQIWGFLDEAEPSEHEEEEMPVADVVFIPSNRNNSGVETLPAWA